MTEANDFYSEENLMRAEEILLAIYERASDARDIEGAEMKNSERGGTWVSVKGKGKRRIFKNDDVEFVTVSYKDGEIIATHIEWPYFRDIIVLSAYRLNAFPDDKIVTGTLNAMKGHFVRLNAKRKW